MQREMSKARKLGEMAALVEDPAERERFKGTHFRNKKAEVLAREKELNQKLDAKLNNEKNILSELSAIGSPSRESAASEFRKCLWFFLFMLIPVGGEFVFSHWIVSYFSLGLIEKYILSVSIVLISLEGMDHYLSAFRRQFPQYDNILFLTLGSISVITTLLLFLFAAEIRQVLYEVTSKLSYSNALEDTVRQAEHFTEQSSGNFVMLMIMLTLSVMIIGGMSYHLAKSLFNWSYPILRRYSQLRSIIVDIQRLRDEIAANETSFEGFEAEYETGFMDICIKRERKAKSQMETAVGKSMDGERKSSIAAFLAFPITLIVMTFLIFFLLKGKAHGAEYICLVDLSASVDVEEYTGKTTEFDKNIKAIGEIIRNSLSEGDSFRLLAITAESFSKPYIIVEARMPKEKGNFGQELAKQKLMLLKELENIQLVPDAKATELLGAVYVSSILFKGKDKKLIIFSDMRQATKTLNIENQDKLDTESLLNKVEELKLIPDLSGVEVWCLGVISNNKSPEYWVGLRQFWESFFSRAGAKLVEFSIERGFTK